ncbi:MAG: sugar ABC transporter ATP-binding protein [Candidatus Humimicrobiaceae bacterium]
MFDKKVILEVRGITKIFPGTIALKNVSMSVNEGEIHGIVGENGAGKSTLMNVICGVLPADEGKIIMYGKKIYFNSPKDAQEVGIGFVHQELSLCPHLSVAENIFIGKLPTNIFKIIKSNQLYQKTKELLALFNMKISPLEKVRNLTVAEQQVVEIIKALSLNCKLLILDEPTSSLTEIEAEVLFKIIKDIKEKGIGILYISHRMSEIFEICDRITILRDGSYIDSVKIDNPECSPKYIINKMIGRNIGKFYPEKCTRKGKELLRVENLIRRGVFNSISFSLLEGEVLGFYGLIGAGRTEVARAICGIDEKDGGKIYLEGKETVINSYSDAITNDIAYVTEDRKTEGLFLKMNIKENIVAGKLKNIKNGILINSRKEEEISKTYVKKLNVKLSSLNQKVVSLSGGNQQRIVIAKWLAIKPKILILDEPTRGIDVGAKLEIHRLLRELCIQGIGIIIISSEMPEIIGMCDRVIVMHEGVIIGEVSNQKINEKDIITLASGQ